MRGIVGASPEPKQMYSHGPGSPCRLERTWLLAPPRRDAAGTGVVREEPCDPVSVEQTTSNAAL